MADGRRIAGGRAGPGGRAIAGGRAGRSPAGFGSGPGSPGVVERERGGRTGSAPGPDRAEGATTDPAPRRRLRPGRRAAGVPARRRERSGGTAEGHPLNAPPRPLPPTTGGSDLRALFGRLLPALLLFQLLLGIEASGAAPWLRPTLSVPPLLAVLVLLAAAFPRRLAALPGTARLPLAAAILLLAGARLAERIAVGLLGRPLDPAGDLPHLGAVASMLTGSTPTLISVLVLAGLGAALIGLLVAVAAALRALGTGFSRGGPRTRWAAAGLAGLALLLAPGLAPPGGAGFGAAARIAAAPFRPALPEIRADPLPRAPALSGADVALLFVESYGVAAFSEPRRRARLEESLGRLAEEAAAAGFDFRSAQIQSPTFGGGSWRAHASMLSGVWIETEDRYRALLASGRETLVRRFAAAGYRTLAFEPGIRGPWPEGDYYGFSEIRDGEGIGYRGPPIGWWLVPDQFILHALLREVPHAGAGPGGAPIFAKVSLIGSHIPYAPIPPYVEDWTRFDTGTAYATGMKPIAHDDYRDLVELGERYGESLDHVFRILGGFLGRYPPRRSLVVVVGDHQPPKLSLHDSDSWATPIHLFSRDPALLDPWSRFGFTRTLLPETGTAWRMSDFPASLSTLFPPPDQAGEGEGGAP